MGDLYVNYGCGLTAPEEWINFDASPTLRIQKLPLIGHLLKDQLNVNFPQNVKYGDIVGGLPIKDGCCDGIYCSHILEHLALDEFRAALQNTHDMLKPGGIFRCVVPDLEFMAKTYINSLSKGKRDASKKFMRDTGLGTEKGPTGIKEFLKSWFGSAHQHLWMWDSQSFSKELEDIGFKKIRNCEFNDSEDDMFNLVEDEYRFQNAVAIECKK